METRNLKESESLGPSPTDSVSSSGKVKKKNSKIPLKYLNHIKAVLCDLPFDN